MLVCLQGTEREGERGGKEGEKEGRGFPLNGWKYQEEEGDGRMGELETFLQ